MLRCWYRLLSRASGPWASRSAVGLGALALAVVLAATPWANAGPPADRTPERAGKAGKPVNPSWAAAVQRGLAVKEYEASTNRLGLQAPNRAHGLRTYFGTSGIRVHGRTGEPRGPELLSLSLAGVGRVEALAPVAPGEVAGDGARVEIRRPGLVEWYLNSEAGLEQGFTLAERPPGDGPLVLELALTRARATRQGERVIFETEEGRSLTYGELAAFDAAGRSLGVRVEVPEASRLQLVVDDGGAEYPVVVDPMLRAEAPARLESDQQDAHLGFAVSGAGDVDGDGYADVIVGAYLYDAGEANEGAAFVFLGSASGIADGNPQSAATQLESDQAGAQLGISVAAAGDVDRDGYDDVIVGARFYDADQTDEGAAFVFLGSASGVADGNPVTAAAQLEANQGSALLGSSVAGAGDVDGDTYDDVIVGAPQYDAGETDEGAAFVFLGSASGVADGNPLTAAAQLESDQDFALLGLDVSGAGDVDDDTYADVIVGAPLYDAGHSNEGAAFVFNGSASGIADGNPLTAAARLESDQDDANLGLSVSGAGDVDADGYDDVIVGADEYAAGQSSEGAAFVFRGSASGIADGNPLTAAAQLESDQVGADFGVSVAGAGDVDGDGYADVIVGAYLYDSGEVDEGAAFVFRGSASGIASGGASTADLQLESDQANAELGWRVAGAGDIDGDGFDDLIVGARSYDAGESNEGAAFVYQPGLASSVPALPGPARALLVCALLVCALLGGIGERIFRRKNRGFASGG